MKILIANKFYYNRGGDCIMSIGLEQLLKAKGHEVAFFSMQYPDNFHSEWEGYFPSQVDFQAGGIQNKLRAVTRIFHSAEVKRNFMALLETFQPDVVHLNNIHSQLSPLIGELAHRKGIKVVWTMHDYKLVCPAYTCLRNGKPCEICFRDPFQVFAKKCMKGSLAASVLAYLEALYWDKNRLKKNTDCFISPSRFLAEKMVEGGFSPSKIRVIPNFTNRDLSHDSIDKEDYICYIGRLSEEKGVGTLIEATRQLPYRLLVVGTGPLKDTFDHNHSHIQFVGFKEWNELKGIIERARFMVIPSEWYENNPLSVIESLCLGTPVLGANIGGIPELIHERNGMLFEAGNKEDLKEKIGQMFNKTFNYSDICSSARQQYSAENYYNKLIEIYEQ
ncbi:MAG: glycosyltransferase [Parabacteroides sp.]